MIGRGVEKQFEGRYENIRSVRLKKLGQNSDEDRKVVDRVVRNLCVRWQGNLGAEEVNFERTIFCDTRALALGKTWVYMARGIAVSNE